MRFPTKRWLMRRGNGAGDAPAALFDRILALRGIEGDGRRAFLEPSLLTLGYPTEMPGMRAAADAFVEAVRKGRPIAIYGDYDVDGVMASTILWHLAGALGAEPPQVYIPHRIEEGYGLNRGALERLKADGAELVVTVDCGVASPDEAAYARELGLDLVITDHHEPRGDGRLPEARAVVHPRVGDAAGFGELCGAAVAWKFAWMTLEVWHGIARERSDEPQRARLPDAHKRALLHWLALAAVGTVADIVPLVGENRTIVAKGLPLIHLTGNAGMDALLDEARLAGARVDAEAVAFQLAPRINAAGRMQHASLAAELFTSADRAQAAGRARELTRLNDERRRRDKEIFDDALARVEVKTPRAEGALPRGIVLWDDRTDGGWSLGIVGIVCSKLVERFACPTILLTRSHDGFRGSGRSIEGVDLHGVLESCREHLTHFGGHAMAAGMGVADEEALARFERAFIGHCDAELARLGEQKLALAIDAEASIGELDLETAVRLEELAPFGRDNPRPAILVRGVEVTKVEAMGREGAHLSLHVRDGGARDGRFLRLVRFKAAEWIGAIGKGSRVDLVLELKINEFRGKREVEGTLLDLAPEGAARIGTLSERRVGAEPVRSDA